MQWKFELSHSYLYVLVLYDYASWVPFQDPAQHLHYGFATKADKTYPASKSSEVQLGHSPLTDIRS